MDNLQSERLEHFPSVSSLLKISLGLILFTIISSAFVYAETISVNIEGNSFDIDYSNHFSISFFEYILYPKGILFENNTIDIFHYNNNKKETTYLLNGKDITKKEVLITLKKSFSFNGKLIKNRMDLVQFQANIDIFSHYEDLFKVLKPSFSQLKIKNF